LVLLPRHKFEAIEQRTKVESLMQQRIACLLRLLFALAYNQKKKTKMMMMMMMMMRRRRRRRRRRKMGECSSECVPCVCIVVAVVDVSAEKKKMQL